MEGKVQEVKRDVQGRRFFFFTAGMACGFRRVLNIFHPEMVRKQDMLSLTRS